MDMSKVSFALQGYLFLSWEDKGKKKKTEKIGPPAVMDIRVLVVDFRTLSAPNRKSQTASDFESRIPNRKNFPQIAVKRGPNRTLKSCDFWFGPLFKSQ